jgi:threonine dehydrogenase-like Zn-dependent dehydrogenase
MYGLGPVAGLDGGGFLSDLVRVPFADAKLMTVPSGVDAAARASASDNPADGWRTVGPYVGELAALSAAGRRVLVLGGLSIGLFSAAVAVALGAAADYVDTDPERLAIAEQLGAEPREWRPDGSALKPGYPVTVTTSPAAQALFGNLTPLRYSSWTPPG